MKTLLFVRYKKSKSILEGGEQGSQKNYNVLARLLGEENITVYHIHDEAKRRSPWDYLAGLVNVLRGYYFGLSPRRVRKIAAMAQQFDYVFIDRSVFGVIAKRLKQARYNGKVICFFHNVEVPYFSAKIPRYMPYRLPVLRCADANDRYSCRYADKIIALNSRDERELARRYGRTADVLIPVAFRDKIIGKPDAEALTRRRPVCLFVGAYFRPNNEGIRWFVQNVLPHVDIAMKVAGKGMAQLQAELALPAGVEVYSDVPDLAPFFEDADVMILPIFEGAGMKVKTCESLMYGKNIIGTSEAFEGYEVDCAQVGALCNTQAEFVAAINDFIAHPRPRHNVYSRRMFLEKYSEEVVVEKFRQVLG